jgi:hypothetical protein
MTKLRRVEAGSAGLLSAIALVFACSAEIDDPAGSAGGTNTGGAPAAGGAAANSGGTANASGGAPGAGGVNQGGTGGGSCTCDVGEVCQNGACACLPDLTDCAGACVDLDSDGEHCGSCTTACPSSQLCSAGVCADGCAADRVACGQSCVDLATSAEHCGECDNACTDGQTCNAGACSGGMTTACVTPSQDSPGVLMENLVRGVVAVRAGSNNYVGWRLFGNEAPNTGFNVYRDGTKLNAEPITGSTNYSDSGAPSTATYDVRAVVAGQEQAASESVTVWAQNYLRIPIQAPTGGSGYSAGDGSVGDLDGDGQYEIVLKWDPANQKDNSQSGITDNVYVDAYELDGTRLWRIDLGRNIRAGAHYTQFMVYDFDGDGKAEVAMKTADGTRDGTGTVIGNASADHRNGDGYVLSGPEFLTIFSGPTGAALATVDYVPARGTVSAWGDNYGNRVDRFLAGVAYVDGKRPSLIMARGYYTRTVIVAWDFRNGELSRRWTFDAPNGNAYAGQGDHSLSIADVDADGRQEVVYGSMIVDDDGQGLYSTGWGHGDALHVGDLVPSRAGLEVFNIQERVDSEGANLRDARTGQALFTIASASGSDEGPGRGVGADIWAGNAGAEFWVAGGGISGLLNAAGDNVGRTPGSCNFLVWWDADPVRELLNSNQINKYGTSGDTRLLTADGCSSNNGTKSTPTLSADLFGDWREEVIWKESNSAALRLYTTTAVTDRRIPTLMHDAQYRVAVAWQNTAYNQPPHPGFFIGDGMSAPPSPNVSVTCR